MKGYLALLLTGLFIFTACDTIKDKVDEAIEEETGCTATDLGKLAEPDLPMCSAAVSCCKYIKGECGETQLLDFPQEVIDACNLNEAVLGEVIGGYQGLTDGDCPAYLTEEACADGLDATRENYRKTLDQGENEFATETTPSCRQIVQETILPLNEEMGDQARYLPAACEVPEGM